MESTQEVAGALVAACLNGEAAIDAMQLAHYAPDAISVEPFVDGPDGAEAHGLDAIRAKNKRWYQNHEIHSFEVEGPFVHGDKFSVIFKMSVTSRSGPDADRRIALREIALYTTSGGKIVREEFFGPPMM